MAYNIADLFEHAVDKFPDRKALACGDELRSFAELEARANRLAHHLAARGVGTGSHVGMCLRNSVEAIETMLAVYKLRAVLINVNFRYTAREMRYVLENADVVAVVYESRFAPQVQEAAAGLALITHLLEVGGGAHYEAALAAASPERDFGERSGDDLYILYTGGTTGMPKGVMWRHEDVWRTLGGGINFVTGEPLPDEWAQSGMGELTGGLTRLCLAPLIHGNAQWAALMALFSGDPVVLLTHFDPHDAWRAIERHKVNVVVLIGDAMARPIIEAYVDKQYDASSVFAISSSAALFSQSVKNQVLEALPNAVLTDSLGSSETGFMGMGMITKDAPPAGGGPRITLNADSIVIDEDDRPIPPGDERIGRLARGGHIPLGYYKDEERTGRLFVEVDGRRYTVPGDFARHEPDGTITLLGRGNTCVNTGGEKVFPEEVEEALMSHPDVFDVLVIGLPDETLGQRVAAVVELRPGAGTDAHALVAHARTGIAGYKVPKSIWFVDKVHRLATGKADYRWAGEHATAHPQEDACAPASATS
ncbi:MAG: acyl-CoA synthetase [Jatrophihabitans sp.]|nr:MAG: acyl-CoA synthetase [Jatrophihabitans sp.]